MSDKKTRTEYKKAVEFVAEHIMEFPREKCQGTMGGGNSSSDSGEWRHSFWFWCSWCRDTIKDGATKPCAKYPFPKFSFLDLMRKLGNGGLNLILRYDCHRDKRRFTLISPRGRICDTDAPLEDLCIWLADTHNEHLPRIPKSSQPVTVLAVIGGRGLRSFDFEIER